jgi:predicted ATP-binding protein involved in virulence
MRIESLTIANVRAIEYGEFHFRPGFNLVVGVNGVGKSTVLDCLCICLSRVMPGISDSRSKARAFAVSDISSGFPFLDVKLSLQLGNGNFSYTRRQWSQQFAKDDVENVERLRRQVLDTERLRDRARNLLRELDTTHSVSDGDFYDPPLAQLKKEARSVEGSPYCLYFATNRATLSGAAGAKSSKAVADRAAAHVDALSARSLQVRQIAEWLRAQQAMGKEREAARRHLTALRSAVSRFLPEFNNLRPSDEGEPTLLVDHQGSELDVRQLSDGERGVLALVLDLARRLSQTSTAGMDPLAETEAIVLIDEIDLHLHPKWQRQIVRNLTSAFPRCQFIATTHSPLVIGEVEHSRIQIISDGHVYSPPHSFGMDSSRVLEEIMEVDSRAQEVQELLSRISAEVGSLHFDQARESVARLTSLLGENDPEVMRTLTLIDFMEGKE